MINSDLRLKIVNMIHKAKEGHIPSSFSIVDIINFLYSDIINFNKKRPLWEKRDYFILSKGHGCAALYVVLEKYGILKFANLKNYSSSTGILGGHPDMTVVPGVEASTGSLVHGFPTAVGLSMGLKIQKKNNKVITLLGDGECQEGTIWESANIANNQNLGNLCVIVDWNGSAAQLQPKDKLVEKWKSFGFNTFTVNGHSNIELKKVFKKIKFKLNGKPNAILAKTIKGKGVKFIEGHGLWHHKIPNQDELKKIETVLKNG